MLGLVAAALAVVVAGRPGVLAPFVDRCRHRRRSAGPSDRRRQSASSLIEVIDAVLVVLPSFGAVVAVAGARAGAVDRALASLWGALSSPESLQVAAGILFGLAVTARLTILFGFPFLILVGGGGTLAAARPCSPEPGRRSRW